MAEYAANFTFTTQSKPSLFQVIAQKSLNDTLHPALQKIALVLSTNFPRRFDWLAKYYDEVFLALNYALQWGYLRHCDATFSEHFYGLKRATGSGLPLSENHRNLTILIAVILPYFRRKLYEKLQIYRLEEADGCFRASNFEDRCKKLLILSQSTFEVLWGLLTVHKYISYMSGKTESQLIELQLLELKLVHAEPESAEDSSQLWRRLLAGQFRTLFTFEVVKSAITKSFEFGAFFLQFLQVWGANKSGFKPTNLPTVPPPMHDGKAVQFRHKCPICMQNWKIPTVLPVSGYVFCFSCIWRHLKDNQTCPVTHLPAKPLDMIRLFDSDT